MGATLSDPITIALLGLLSGFVSAGVAYLTQRTSAQASTKAATIASRTDIEREAFERAKAFYTDVIDRQQAEIQGLESDVKDLRGALLDVQVDLRACRDECRSTRAELAKAQGRLPVIFPHDEGGQS